MCYNESTQYGPDAMLICLSQPPRPLIFPIELNERPPNNTYVATTVSDC